MSYSLNEVAATARKAARGVGYDWGVADEFGRTTRQLYALGQEACAPLAGLLSAVEGVAAAALMPRLDEGRWLANAQICPVYLGLSLCDRATTLPANWQATKVLQPLLLLPFLQFVAAVQKQPLILQADCGKVLIDRHHIEVKTPLPHIAERLQVSGSDMAPTAHGAFQRAHPDPAIWQTLEAFAHRTYAPATELSRQLGAGSAQSDND